MRIFNKNINLERRRKLRKNFTATEKVIWDLIKNDQLGVRFRRQYGIGFYIADFYCPKLLLVIEIDGDYHQNTKEYDVERKHYFESLKITEIRFSNKECLENSDIVIEKIKHICASLML